MCVFLWLPQAIPRERRTQLFSATMTNKVAKLQRACLVSPVKVRVSYPALCLEGAGWAAGAGAARSVVNAWQQPMTLVSVCCLGVCLNDWRVCCPAD